MLWTSSQQTVIDQFIQEIKTIGWFKQAGEPSKFGDKIVSSSNKKHCDS